MNSLLPFIKEKESTKRWKLGALYLISAMIAAASWVSAPPAAAGSKEVRLSTSDSDPGGYMRATITYRQSKRYKGYYEGSIDGKLLDREKDGYCVIGAYQAIVKGRGLLTDTLRPRSPACPESMTQRIHHPFKKAKNVRIQVCLTKNGKVDHCSPYDH